MPILLFLLFIIFSSCGPTAQERAAQHVEELLTEIEEAQASHDYNHVIALCDSLDKLDAKDSELSKKALRIWTEAQVSLLNDTAKALDTQIDSLTINMQQLMPEFEKVEIKGIGSHRVPKMSSRQPLTSHNGIEPRLGDEDNLWSLVVNVAGSQPLITGLRLKNSGATLLECIIENASERRSTETTGEMLTINAEEAEPLAQILTEAPDESYSLDIVGQKKTVNLKLSQTDVNGIIITNKMAQLREERQRLLKKRELISRKIQVAQSHLERITGEIK